MIARYRKIVRDLKTMPIESIESVGTAEDARNIFGIYKIFGKSILSSLEYKPL